MARTERLGVLAGRGSLARELTDAALLMGRDIFVFIVEGEGDPALFADVPHIVFRLNSIGKFIALAQEREIRDVVLTGVFHPWQFLELAHDPWVLKRLPKLLANAYKGNDALLSFLIDELEKADLRVIGPDDLAQQLIPKLGILGRHRPTADEWRDIRIGASAAHELGQRDIGQAVVVRAQEIIGTENADGTDALIASILESSDKSPAPILVKMKKPQQEMRADPPAIGPATVRNAATAGFRGIAVEAGGAVLLERDKCVRLADEFGLFLVAIDPRSDHGNYQFRDESET